MRAEPLRDVVKVWLYAVASVALGAWMTPLVYNAGKALAEISSAKQTNAAIRWLADVSRGADFPHFFTASLFLAGALLFLPFGEWFGGGRGGQGLRKLLRLVVPTDPTLAPDPHLLRRNPYGLWQAVTAFSRTTSLFLFIAAGLCLTGLLTWSNPDETLFSLLVQGLALAIAWGLAQEMLFRGIAMGIFLRAMRPTRAIAMSAALFALLHFLNPPPGVGVVDPDAAGVGFELLGKILLQLADPLHFTTSFVPLLALGVLLAYARWRTASLWLPIGINAGWILANSLASSATHPADGDLALLLAGASMKDGLVPLAGFIAVGLIIKQLLPPRHDLPPAPAT